MRRGLQTSCMAANKVPGVRAAPCYDKASARNSREHNDSNVLTLGGRLLTESVAVALAGGLLGLGLAFACLRPLIALSPVELIPAFQEVRVDSWVLLFTFGVSVLTGVLFGLAPALRASRSDLYGAIRDVI